MNERYDYKIENKKYPNQIIQDAIHKAMAISRNDIINPPPKTLSNNTAETNKSVYFVSTYDPTVQHPAIGWKEVVNNFNEGKNCESAKLKINYSFRKGPSLKELLMFRKTPGSKQVFKCSDNCLLCRKHLHSGDELHGRKSRGMGVYIPQ